MGMYPQQRNAKSVSRGGTTKKIRPENMCAGIARRYVRAGLLRVPVRNSIVRIVKVNLRKK
jgi:hypothetical protein